MVVGGHRENLLGVLLAHHVAVQEMVDLWRGGGEGEGGGREGEGLRQFGERNVQIQGFN